MLRYSTILILLLLGFQLQAQFPPAFSKKGPKINGVIYGRLIDSVSQEAISFATVSLTKQGRDKILNGDLTDDYGKFRLQEIPTGKYDIHFSFLGYVEKVMEIELTPESPDANLSEIFLTADNIILDEVEITDQRSLIENKVDKLVYNADQDATITGGDAADVLRNVPLLSVDLEGNVSLRGSSNIQILINGKPSGMFASSVSDALKTIPANQIKRVEVITSPSAKYDAEGSGGIINIITKKNIAEGIAGSFSGSTGTRQDNAVLNLSTAKGRFGGNTNGSVFYSLPALGEVKLDRYDTLQDNQIRTLHQEGVSNTGRIGFNVSGSAYYDFNAYNSLNTSFQYSGFGFNSDAENSVNLDDPLGMLSTSFTRDLEGNNLFSGYDYNLDYKRTFPDSDKEFVVAGQISGNLTDQHYQLLETNAQDLVLRDEIQDNDGNNIEKTIQIDYTYPFKKAVKMEVGAKTVLRKIDSYYSYSVPGQGNGNYIIDPVRTNTFYYNQNVYAGYLSFSYVLFKKLSVISGIRMEFTGIGGSYESGETLESNQYSNILPNITISRSLKNFRTLKLSYNQRIQRPSIYYINPYVNSSDNYNIVIGNPGLTPEKSHQLELSYNSFFKGFAIFNSVFYKYSEDIIQSIVNVNESGVSENSFYNVGTNHSFGVNLFGSKSINRFTIRGGGNINSYNYASSDPAVLVSNPFGFVYLATLNGSYNFPFDLKIDAFGFFRSSERTIQGIQPSFSIFGMGFKKDFPKLKASVGLRVIEPFFENKVFESKQRGNGFYQESSFSIPFRSIGFNLEYRFGEVKFKERKSAIENQDLKQQNNNSGGASGGGVQ